MGTLCKKKMHCQIQLLLRKSHLICFEKSKSEEYKIDFLSRPDGIARVTRLIFVENICFRIYLFLYPFFVEFVCLFMLEILFSVVISTLYCLCVLNLRVDLTSIFPLNSSSYYRSIIKK